MELNEKHIEWVGIYLQGKLEGEELDSFLMEVKHNTLLQEELRIQQAILDGVEHKNNQELKARLQKISEENYGHGKDVKLVSMRFIKIVSSIAAVVLFCFAVYFLLDPSADTESIYSSYFEPSELTITRSTDQDSDLVTLKELYNTKEYQKALPLFQNVIAQDPTSSNLRLAYGNSLLKCNKLDEARLQFQYIIDAKDPLYSDQSRWYLALLELKEGNLDKSKELLSRLGQDTSSDFHSEALRLLEELKAIE